MRVPNPLRTLEGKNAFMKAFHQKGTNIEGDVSSKGVFQRLSSNSLCLKSH